MSLPGPDPGQARGHYAAQQAAPGLDAGAAQLRPDGAPRPDRRAIALLAGIVALLVVAIAAMLRALGGGQPAGPERAQELVIPDAPKVATAAPTAAPASAASLPLPPPPPPLQPPALPALPLAPAMSRSAWGPPPEPRPEPSLAERRSGGGESTTAGDPYLAAMLTGLHAPEVATPEPAAAPSTRATAARPLQRPDMLLVRGTHIRCVLQTRIVTDIPGQTACVVAEPVYSFDGRRLLVPAGSRVLGQYGGAPLGSRVAVVWDRILTPTGLDVTMASPGVDGLGGAGHPGDYDAHWGARIGSAMLVSLLGDAFKYAAAQEGPSGTLVGEGGVVVRSPYESATARTLERLAGQALDVRRPPTVTIVQGTLVNIHVARDVDFSAVMGSPP